MTSGEDREIANEAILVRRVARLADQALQDLDQRTSSAVSRSARRAVSDLELRDIEDVCDLAGQAARIDADLFANYYGSFLASLEGFDRTLSRIAAGLADGSIAGESHLASAASLVGLGAAELTDRIDQLGRSSSTAVARGRIRSDADRFSSDLGELRSQVTEAVSRFGLDIRKLEWTVYAADEVRRADRWRIAALLLLAASFALSLISAFYLAGESGSFTKFCGHTLAVLSLAGLAAYTGAQSAEHRREARMANHNALDYVALMLLVQGLDADGKQEVLRNFAVSRFIQGTTDATSAQTPIATTNMLDFLTQALGRSGDGS